MRRSLPFLIVALVAALALGGGYALYRAKLTPAPAPVAKTETPSDKATPSEKGTPSKIVAPATGGHVRGSDSAVVTIEEFGDFECPPCSLMAAHLKKMEEEFGSRLRVVFHNFPLAVHAHARTAAHVAEAADLQGRYWEMHDLLYQEQLKWAKGAEPVEVLMSFAGTLGLDVERFKKDVEGEVVKERVEADKKLGMSRGVTSTPTLFLNNTLVPPTSLNPNSLHQLVEAALAENEKPKS